MSFQWLKPDNKIKKFVLATISALLLAIPWTWGAGFTLFIALVPLLLIEKYSHNKKIFFCFFSYTIFLWHLLSVFWLSNAYMPAFFAAVATTTALWSIPILLYSYFRRNNQKTISYIILTSGLIAFEYLTIFNTEISWPWVVLGNGFANNHSFIQWYEYTGILGGSLWVIITNIAIFEFLTTKKRKFIYGAIGIILAGASISKIIYHTYTIPEGGSVKVAVLQPNFDPYEQKFSMGRYAQIEILDSMLNTLPSDIDYILLPETAIDEILYEGNIDKSPTIKKIKSTISQVTPNADMIMGSTTYLLYNTDTSPTQTARPHGENEFIDFSNSSLSINPNRDTEVYKKIKLVIGVEMLPFTDITAMFGDLSINLGGASGTFLPQDNPYLFSHTTKGIKAGGVICYEGIYGEFFSQFVKLGAEAMFIVSNDGWWKDTYGYKQLFSYAQLRAIETRREIGRSANTGISGIINAKGDAVQTLGWWERGVLIGEVKLNTEITFYTMQGDYIGSISWYVFILMLLYSVSLRFKKKLLMD